jgi:hypothetical protein
MLREVNYEGPPMADTSVPDKRKADGIIPAHGSDAPMFTEEAFQAAGIHYAELVYNGDST